MSMGERTSKEATSGGSNPELLLLVRHVGAKKVTQLSLPGGVDRAPAFSSLSQEQRTAA